MDAACKLQSWTDVLCFLLSKAIAAFGIIIGGDNAALPLVLALGRGADEWLPYCAVWLTAVQSTCRSLEVN